MYAENHITSELREKIRYSALLNSDTVQFTWGIWRYVAGGIIEEAKYFYDTATIGPYTFPEFYGWVPEFYSKKPCPPKSLLYKYMLELNGVLACIFVNNSYVARIFTDRIEYIDIEGKDDRDVKLFSTPLEQLPLANIGWVKTVVKCFSVAMLPFALHMDITNNTAYVGNGKWVPIVGSPMYYMDIDFPLYKQLLTQSNAVGVYHDLSDDQDKFI